MIIGIVYGVPLTQYGCATVWREWNSRNSQYSENRVLVRTEIAAPFREARGVYDTARSPNLSTKVWYGVQSAAALLLGCASFKSIAWASAGQFSVASFQTSSPSNTSHWGMYLRIYDSRAPLRRLIHGVMTNECGGFARRCSVAPDGRLHLRYTSWAGQEKTLFFVRWPCIFFNGITLSM